MSNHVPSRVLPRLAGAGLAVALLALPMLVVAGVVGPLTSFSNNTVADAEQVNGNFEQLRTGVNRLAGVGPLRARSAGTGASGAVVRQVRVDGTELAAASTADGLFVAVVDRNTLAVDAAKTKNWPVGTAAEALALATMLNALTTDSVVLLASKGNVSTYLEEGNGTIAVLDALLRCGVSETVVTADAQTNVAHIGVCGNGPGTGLVHLRQNYNATTAKDGGAAEVGGLLVEGNVVGNSPSNADSFFGMRGTYPALVNRFTSCGTELSGAYPNHLALDAVAGELLFTRGGQFSVAHAGWSNNCNAEPKVIVKFYIWSPIAQAISVPWSGLDEVRLYHGSGESPTYTQVGYSASEIDTVTSVSFAKGSNTLIFYSRWNNQAAAVNATGEFLRAKGLRIDWRRLLKDLRR